MSREESPLEVEWVHPDVVRAITQERDAAQKENLDLQGRLEKAEARTRALQDQISNSQLALDQDDRSSREAREVLEQRFRSERGKRIKAEELAEELEVSNFRLVASIKSQANLLAERGTRQEEEVESWKAKSGTWKAKAEEIAGELEVSMAAINSQANLPTEGETRQAEEIEAWKAKYEILRVKAKARVKDLKSKLATSNHDLFHYYTFTGFTLRQESEFKEDLKAWAVFQQSQCRYYGEVFSTLTQQCTKLGNTLVIYDQTLRQELGLKAWVQSLYLHLTYCLQVGLRLNSQRDELVDITNKMVVYSQPFESEETLDKMLGMNLQRDLTEAGYWPINPSHGTIEAIPTAGPTSAKKVVENLVQETTPAASKASGQIAKEPDDYSGNVPLDEIIEVQKTITPMMPSTDDEQTSREVHKTRSPKLPEDIENALIQKEHGVSLALPDTCQDVVVGDAKSRDDHNILQYNNADVVSIEKPAAVKHLKKKKKKAKKYIHATWV